MLTSSKFNRLRHSSNLNLSLYRNLDKIQAHLVNHRIIKACCIVYYYTLLPRPDYLRTANYLLANIIEISYPSSRYKLKLIVFTIYTKLLW